MASPARPTDSSLTAQAASAQARGPAATSPARNSRFATMRPAHRSTASNASSSTADKASASAAKAASSAPSQPTHKTNRSLTLRGPEAAAAVAASRALFEHEHLPVIESSVPVSLRTLAAELREYIAKVANETQTPTETDLAGFQARQRPYLSKVNETTKPVVDEITRLLSSLEASLKTLKATAPKEPERPQQSAAVAASMAAAPSEPSAEPAPAAAAAAPAPIVEAQPVAAAAAQQVVSQESAAAAEQPQQTARACQALTEILAKFENQELSAGLLLFKSFWDQFPVHGDAVIQHAKDAVKELHPSVRLPISSTEKERARIVSHFFATTCTPSIRKAACEAVLATLKQ
jgi:hypothetical protein